ncbi:hypothetical protein [Halococcus salsus]|uniref:hypothetical protein n=1 Tax=Halococcus salsus TaxID=2162894 RepID=UPI001356EC01|nr:hypothetical protein [Halococcus salsus]
MTPLPLPATAESVVETVDERRPTVAPADLVLLALPALLIAGFAGGVASPLAVPTGLAAGTIPALATLGYVLFYDPPTAVSG